MSTQEIIKNSIFVKQQILESESLINLIEKYAELFITTFQQGGKVLFCGNGGSAADAQHISAELSGRFNYDRPPLFAEALHVNSSFVTAVANDYSFEQVYARMVKAMGKKNDILVAISTSGNSPNIVNAVLQANELGMITLGLSGENGGRLSEVCTSVIKVPSTNTARIQESHIMIGHIICEIVEKEIFPE